MAKITQKEYDQMHAQYARMEAFDQWTTPFTEDNAITVDKDYQFQPKTRTFKAGRFVVKSMLRTMLPIANKLLFDLKIEGKDNLKQVDNAIRVSNHVMLLDTMINFQVAFGHRHYMTGAAFQLKKGFSSKFFRAGGFLPLASSIKAMSNLDKCISEIFENGNSVVTFYAGKEQRACRNDGNIVQTAQLDKKKTGRQERLHCQDLPRRISPTGT